MAALVFVPMEGIERINTVVVINQVRPQQLGTGFPQKNLYAMEVDRSNKRYYNCEDFKHIAKYCKNQGMGLNQRIDTMDNLKEKENLRTLAQILTIGSIYYQK